LGAIRPGAAGASIYAAGEQALGRSAIREHANFVAHGVGLITHEVPHLIDNGSVPYPADDAARPLEVGMVLSIETTLKHPERGFIKLEDTIALTPGGAELFGRRGHGWNRAGARTRTEADLISGE
jgi:Xaa-Pro aminopeptidase